VRHLWLFVLVCIGCAAAPPPPVPVSILPPPPAPPPTPRTDADRDRDFASAWSAWRAGDRASATATFRTLVRELDELPAKTAERALGAPNAPLAVSADGAHAIVLSGGGAYSFDAAGAPRCYDVASASSVEFLARSSLAVLSGAHWAIVDANALTHVLDATRVAGYRATGNVVVYQATDAIHVWDATTRTERRAIALRDGETMEPTSSAWSPDEKEFSCRMNGEGESLAVFDEKGGRLDLPGPMDAAGPSYSADGKYFAYAYPVVGGKGYAGKTLLYDRATRRLVASTGASKYPTATRFTSSGKWLVVGELRRLSILEIPSLRVLATTPPLRQRAGPDDDLQNITGIEVLRSDVGFWAATADGTSGVFRLPSGALVWQGRGERTVDAAGTQRFSDREQRNMLVTIDPKLAVAERPLTQAELAAPYSPGDPAADRMRTALEKTVCTARKRLFPIEACR
jgi:hypothetical protein